jgi:hypothetical protein
MKPITLVPIVVCFCSTIPRALSLAVPEEILQGRQNDINCERRGLKATSISTVNEASSRDKRNFNGVSSIPYIR